MINRLLLLPALVLVAVSLHAPTGDAYETFRNSSGQRITWDLSDNSLATVENNRVLFTIGTTGMDDTETAGHYSEFTAIRRAFDQWNAVSHSNWETEYIGGAPNEQMSNDSVNTVFFDKVDANMDNFTLGQTVVTFIGSNMVDADIRLNDPDFNWDTADGVTTGLTNRSYIENVMVHEIGHFFGLDHSFVSSATMLANTPNGGISGITPADDDLAAVGLQYGNASFGTSFGTINGTVTSPVGGGAFGVHVAAVNMMDWQVKVGALTEANGTYSIVGVPPGRYWLVCAPVVRSELSGNSRWDNVLTSFQPQIHGVATSTPGVPTEFVVTAGSTTNSADFTLAALDKNVFEANDSTGAATGMALGEALIAYINPGSNHDFYSFTAATNDDIDLVVIAQQMRSPGDLRFRLIGNNQSTVLLSSLALESPVVQDSRADDAQSAGNIEAAQNRDPLIEAFTIPSQGGTVYAHVRPFGASVDSDTWYLFTAARPTDNTTVDQFACTLSVSPTSVDAGSADTAVVTVTARNKYGVLIPGVSGVTLHIDAADVPMVETPANSGTWVHTINAAGSAETDVLTATVDSVDIIATATLYHVGSVDGGQSTVVANPDGIFGDGVDTSEIRVTPRDAAGSPIFDSGLTVVINADVGTVGAVTFDSSTGQYVATYTSPASDGTATISATITALAVTPDETITLSGSPTPITPPQATEKRGGCQVGAGSSVNPLLVLALVLLLAVSRRRFAGRPAHRQ